MKVGSPCIIDGCDKPSIARGWCSGHYHRWQRYGDVNATLRKVSSWNGQKCMVDGCDNRIYAHGYCEKHLASVRRRLNPEKQKIRNLASAIRRKAKQELMMGRPRTATCEVCNQPPAGRGNRPESGICFDHDHKTGKPRGWLCDRCNKMLGLVGDSEELLYKLIGYLKEHADGSAHIIGAELASGFDIRRTWQIVSNS